MTSFKETNFNIDLPNNNIPKTIKKTTHSTKVVKNHESKRILSISYFKKVYGEYLEEISSMNRPYFTTDFDHLYPLHTPFPITSDIIQ